MARRILPWAETEECATDRQARAEARSSLAEATADAPAIREQADYLESRAVTNGFTLQLRAGFTRRLTEQ
jgi:hypothetical protein